MANAGYGRGPNPRATSSAQAYGNWQPPASGTRVGGSGPVSRSRQDFVTTDEQEIRFIRAYNRAKQKAMAAAAARRQRERQRQKQQATAAAGASIPSGYGAGPAPQAPVVNPYKGLGAAVQRDVGESLASVRGADRQAQQALAQMGGDPFGDTAGAEQGDIAGAAIQGISDTGSDIQTGFKRSAAEFILKQLQQQQGQEQGGISPSTLRQIVAAGLDPSQLNLGDPYAVAQALGQAQFQKGQKLSLGEISALVAAGIDPKQYADDREGAARALGKSRRGKKAGPSKEEVRRILQGLLE